jgi:fatty-acyl-CoA synthase
MSLQDMGGVGDLLIDAIERHGSRIAFEQGGSEITYAQLGVDVAHAISYFEACGLKEGDRIAQISANRYEMFVIIAAAYIGGYVSLALQYNADFDDHFFAVDDIQPALLFVDEERMVRAEQLLAASSHGLRVASYAEVVSGVPYANMVAAPLGTYMGRTDAGKCARIMQTGGTSGKPKAVMTSSASLTFQVLAHIAANGFDGDTRMLIASPISHGGGSFIPPVLVKGGRVVIERAFKPEAVIKAVTVGQINTLFMVPTMMYALMDHPDAVHLKPGQIRRLIYGAAPASAERVRQAMTIFGPVLLQSYGLSEAPGTLLYLSPEDHQHPDPARLTSAGRPYPGVIARLMLDGKEVPLRSGEIGEIVVRAPHVMIGYWNAPELSAEAVVGGWLHTGDLARVDEHGFFHIVSRLKDMIISGGFNVYACEVEQALEAHAAVAASAVIGIPDPKWGEAVSAFVVKAEGAEVTPEELIAFVRERKGPVKTPKTVTFLDQLPLTKLGKLDKKQLRLEFWGERDREVN